MIDGACHCGRLRWTARFEPAYLVSCNCSLCHRYGALWAHGTEGTVTVETQNGVWQGYRHGDRLITFHFCGTCGCVTHYASHPGGDPDDRLSVNMRMAGHTAIKGLRIRHFDGADSWRFLD